MATTNENLKDDQDAYSAAFNEEQTTTPEPTEDEAFGISPEVKDAESDDTPMAEAAAEDGAEGQSGEPVDVAIVIDGGDMVKEAEDGVARETAEAAAEEPGEPAEVVAEADEPSMDIEKETQRLKSWEGRLKAMEAKLKAAGADSQEEQAEAVSDAIEQAADATDTPADEDQVEQIAEQVESGAISTEQAMKQLAEDFGDDFVKMIEAIAVAKAKEAGAAATAELGKTVDEVINDIVDTKAKAHFEKIADVHPDFNEIGSSAEFKTFIESMPEDKKAAAMQVIGNGSAKQIIGLLSEFKEANAAGAASGAETPEELTQAQGESIVEEATNDEALDAAEGVRSSGMKLPDQPSTASSYEDAWNEA